MRSIGFSGGSVLRAASTAVALAVLFAVPTQAQFSGPSSAGGVITVEQAKTTRIGREVTLEGFIIEHIREDYYMFRDQTGQMRAEIERPIWRGRKVDPQTKVRIRGDVDRGILGRYISVERLQVLQ